jgi:hypothetical protein
MVSSITGVSIATTVRPRGRALGMLALCMGLFYLHAGTGETASAAVGAKGAQFCNGIRLEDEIVLVNVRNACGRCDSETLREAILVERYEITDETGHRRWKKSDLESFLAFDPSVPTVFYVHGNQMTNWDAKCQGLALYRRLVNCGDRDRPIRFVIFSWPSAKVAGLLRDVRIKALRTGPAGCQLGWLLDQMPAESQISLIGFSFGARVVTAGLHVLGGGDLGCGLQLENRNNTQLAVNVVLVAAGVHAHWLGEGQHHGLAMTQVNRMFMLNNCADIAMRYYWLSTSDHSRPQAMGLYGPTCISADYAAKIRKRDVSRYAGSEHDLFRYLCAPGATCQVWDYAVNIETAVAAPELQAAM